MLTLLQKAYGFAGQAVPAARPLPAPQANVMASVAKGVFQGGLPWTFIFIGMAVAVGLIILDAILERRQSTFRTPVLAVAIGFYLPFSQSVAIFIGGVIATLVKRALVRLRATKEMEEASEQRSVLFASGLITGEALMGIIVAIPGRAHEEQGAGPAADEPLAAEGATLLAVGPRRDRCLRRLGRHGHPAADRPLGLPAGYGRRGR